jgi:hypothetical protein
VSPGKGVKNLHIFAIEKEIGRERKRECDRERMFNLK